MTKDFRSLAGQYAVITGGTQGLGETTARLLLLSLGHKNCDPKGPYCHISGAFPFLVRIQDPLTHIFPTNRKALDCLMK